VPEPTDGADENALCFAIMTGNSPETSPPFLLYLGTFLNATDNYAGLLYIRADQL
jgi:hypothetical protein